MDEDVNTTRHAAAHRRGFMRRIADERRRAVRKDLAEHSSLDDRVRVMLVDHSEREGRLLYCGDMEFGLSDDPDTPILYSYVSGRLPLTREGS